MFDTTMIGNKIKQARIDKNMTQLNLADAMGVSYQAVSNWERGNSMPDISKLGDLCRTLELSVNELLGLEENAPNAVTKAMEQKPMTMEELKEVAPMLPPEELKARVKNPCCFGSGLGSCDEMKEQEENVEPDKKERRKRKLDLSRIADMAPFLELDYLDSLIREADLTDLDGLDEVAPFLSRSTLDYLVEQADIDEMDVVEIAPFLSKETVDKLVSRCTEAEKFGVLEDLAPFISRETLDRLAEQIQPDSIWQVASLAPFISRNALDILVQRCEQADAMDALEELAPFVSAQTLDAMVDRYIEAGRDTDLSDIYPFLSKTALRKLAEYQLRRKDLDTLEDLVPFL